ncbi:MAG: IPT/TIG domain-containing protein [Nitrospira sp.]|nr:IPT/TIG domain-containing protein [Nitrospira sp.]
MQRQCSRELLLYSVIVGLLLCGSGTSVSATEEPAKGPTNQAPHSKPATATKPAAKGKSQKAAAGPSTGPSSKYASAETAAKAPACFGEAPKIHSVKPDEGKPGDRVTILGKGFGPAACLRSVSFGPGYPASFTFVNETQVTAVVPRGRRNGMAMMTLTTASGEDSKAFLVK